MRIGVDEAGKGPVLGSMFAAAVRGPRAAIPDGVADSKTLSASRRAALDERLRASERIAVAVAEVPVARIDGPEDMNTLTVAAHADSLSGVARGGDRALLDAGDTDEERFARRVADRLDGETGHAVTVDAEHGADAHSAHVAAASVVAKVARDAHVDALADAHDRPVGSGYPSDPRTRSFLREHVRAHGSLPDCARTTWSTSDDVLAAAEQSSLDAF